MNDKIISYLDKLKTDEKSAYKAGHDCGVHGANTENCHFRYFGSKALMQAWERGNKEAKK